jgi:hypothetical protein
MVVHACDSNYLGDRQRSGGLQSEACSAQKLKIQPEKIRNVKKG